MPRTSMESEKIPIFWDNKRKAALCRTEQESQVFHNVKTPECPEADEKEYRADVNAFDRFFTGVRVLREPTAETRLVFAVGEDWRRVAKMSRQIWGSFPPDDPEQCYIVDPDRRLA